MRTRSCSGWTGDDQGTFAQVYRRRVSCSSLLFRTHSQARPFARQDRSLRLAGESLTELRARHYVTAAAEF